MAFPVAGGGRLEKVELKVPRGDIPQYLVTVRTMSGQSLGTSGLPQVDLSPDSYATWIFDAGPDLLPGESYKITVDIPGRAWPDLGVAWALHWLGADWPLADPYPLLTRIWVADEPAGYDLADFGRQKASFGSRGLGGTYFGDLDANSTVELEDFGILKDNFGVKAVPEPPTFVTGLIAFALIAASALIAMFLGDDK